MSTMTRAEIEHELLHERATDERIRMIRRIERKRRERAVTIERRVIRAAKYGDDR